MADYPFQMRSLVSPSTTELSAPGSATASRSGDRKNSLSSGGSRGRWTKVLGLIAAVGLATSASAQIVATELFSDVLAISVMPNRTTPESFSWGAPAWPTAEASAPRAISAGAARESGDEVFAQLFGRRTLTAGGILLPLGGDAALNPASSAGKTEVFYDSDSALFGGAQTVEVEPGYARGIAQSTGDLAQAFGYRGLGNVLASFAALQRESLTAGANGEASYAPLMWSPTASMVTNSTGLASFVYATGSGGPAASSGSVDSPSRSSLFGENARAEPTEPATPDFETYLVIGTALGLLGLMGWRRQPQHLHS